MQLPWNTEGVTDMSPPSSAGQERRQPQVSQVHLVSPTPCQPWQSCPKSTTPLYHAYIKDTSIICHITRYQDDILDMQFFRISVYMYVFSTLDPESLPFPPGFQFSLQPWHPSGGRSSSAARAGKGVAACETISCKHGSWVGHGSKGQPGNHVHPAQ